MKSPIKCLTLASVAVLGLQTVYGTVLVDPGIITVTAGSEFSADFVPSNLVDDETLEGIRNTGGGDRPSGHQNNHWLAAQNVFSEQVTFEFGTTVSLASVDVLNTSNTNWNDSETDTFTISTSLDGSVFSDPSAPIALQSYEMGFQNVPLEIEGVAAVRFNVFNDVNLTNDPPAGTDVRVGLNEVRFNAVPEPSTSVLLLLSITGIFFRRQKR